MKKYVSILMLFVFVITTAFYSSSNDWKFIGDKMVGFGVDHDVIVTGNTNDDFRKLKLKVTSGPLKVYDMKVYFDNGSVQDVALRQHIRQGGESRVIDLDGGLRHIKKIEFWYETKGFLRGRSRVAVWGSK
ncbi:MAG: DUF2541 family protein [Chitinophagaceae bacterium]|nr:DUF2541 family protein [Chitinophagaceae bacterium]